MSLSNLDEAEDSSAVIENLRLQLSEIEMLQSMFPGTQELCLDETVLLSEFETVANGERNFEELQARIGFTLNIQVREPQVKLEVICQFAHEYPAVPPIIFLRAASLTRIQHNKLTENLLNFVEQMGKGELYICGIVQWLQENATDYLTINFSDLQCDKTITKSKETAFSRMWIYSHHLYSKIKRRDLIFYANELDLTGFSMTGKPGMIVVEGFNSQVEEFWGRVRRWQWKRIVMKEKEDYEITEENPISKLRKFERFCERSFEPRQSKGKGHHGDRGLLFSFLKERGCGHIFPYFFGVEGRPAEPDSD